MTSCAIVLLAVKEATQGTRRCIPWSFIPADAVSSPYFDVPVVIRTLIRGASPFCLSSAMRPILEIWAASATFSSGLRLMPKGQYRRTAMRFKTCGVVSQFDSLQFS